MIICVFARQSRNQYPRCATVHPETTRRGSYEQGLRGGRGRPSGEDCGGGDEPRETAGSSVGPLDA